MKCSLFVGLIRSESLNVVFYICSMQSAYNPKPNDHAGIVVVRMMNCKECLLSSLKVLSRPIPVGGRAKCRISGILAYDWTPDDRFRGSSDSQAMSTFRTFLLVLGWPEERIAAYSILCAGPGTVQLGENGRCHQSGSRDLNKLDTARPKQTKTALFLDIGDEM
jgi:hypothetical protein